MRALSFDTALFVDLKEPDSEDDGSYIVTENMSQYRKDLRRVPYSSMAPFFDANGHGVRMANIAKEMEGALVKVDFQLTAIDSCNLIMAAQDVSVVCRSIL